MKLIALAAMLMASMMASAEEFTVDGLTYSTNSNRVNLISGAQASGDVVIPSTVKSPTTNKTYTVKWIGTESFMDNTKITSVTIPNTVTIIYNRAFEGCTNLCSVSLPDSLLELQKAAFLDADKLTYIRIPSSVKVIGESCFTASGLKDVYIEDGVLSIYSYAFYHCDSLKSIHLPSTLTYIGQYAFEDSKLTSITLPSTLATVASSAFTNCLYLNTICCLGKTPADITVWAANQPSSYFSGTISNRVLWVPVGCRSTYASNSYWGKFGYVMELGGNPTGDIDGNGKVDVTDITSIMKEILQ